MHRASLWTLGLALLMLAPFLVQMAGPFLTPFFLAAILATVMHPVQQRLAVRLGRPALATALVTLATGLLVGVLLVGVGVAISQELSAAYDSLSRRSVQEGGWPAMAQHAFDRVIEVAASRLPVDETAIRAQITERLQVSTGYVLGTVGAAVGGVTSALVTALLVTLFLYFTLLYGDGWVRQVTALLPLERSVTDHLVRAVRDSVVANVNGVLVVAVGQGLLLAAGFSFVGLRSPILWGAIGGLASVVPVLGPPLIWLPAVVGFVVSGDYVHAVVLGLWGGLVVGSFDNLVRPFVIGARVQEHPMLIGLAAIGGTVAFGPIGLLLGPLLVSLVAAIVREILRLLPAQAPR